jgi:hypothetical protein
VFLVLRGVPDDRVVRLAPAGLMRQPAMMVGGHAHFLPLPGEPMPGAPLFLGGTMPASVSGLPRVPVINTLADADVHARSLQQAAQLLQQLGGPACLNHPLAVLATGRDAVARQLAGIDGLQVPTTVRVRATRVAQLREAMRAAGLRFPVLVRLAGQQGGLDTVRVMHDEDWEALHPLGWGGRDLYLTQFVDFRDADGCYRNVRIAMIGGAIVPCLLHEGTDWQMRPPDVAHGPANAGANAPQAAPQASRQQRLLDRFANDHLPGLRSVLQEAARRLRLDCFAIDGSLRSDGCLLVFEANASNPTQEDMRVPAVADAVRALLARPGAWRGAPLAAGRDSGRP